MAYRIEKQFNENNSSQYCEKHYDENGVLKFENIFGKNVLRKRNTYDENSQIVLVENFSEKISNLVASWEKREYEDGKLIASHYSDGKSKKYSYDEKNRLVCEIISNGIYWKRIFDDEGKLTYYESNETGKDEIRIKEFRYNDQGTCIYHKGTQNNGEIFAEWHYDDFGRVLSHTNSDGEWTKCEKLSNGLFVETAHTGNVRVFNEIETFKFDLCWDGTWVYEEYRFDETSYWIDNTGSKNGIQNKLKNNFSVEEVLEIAKEYAKQ
jgi:YD repeat-containing protein